MRAVATAVVAAGGLAALPALAQLPWAKPELLPPDRAFRLSARALDGGILQVRFDVAEGYYLYRDRLSFRVEPVPAEAALLPAGVAKHDPFFGDVETYRGVVEIRVPLARTAAPGEAITLFAESQGCADVGVCYPPNREQVKLAIPARGSHPGDFVVARPKGPFD